jgi:hypothetical protein
LALATLPADMLKYSNCQALIRRAILDPKSMGQRHRGPDRVAAVFRDCAGAVALEHRFQVRTLRRALRHMPADLKRYSQCAEVVGLELARRGQQAQGAADATTSGVRDGRSLASTFGLGR